MKPNRLFWDIETSYDVVASFRIGQKVNIHHDAILRERAIICICWKWEGQKKVHSLEWDNGCDRQILINFAKVAAQADELVAQNGDKFDVRWLNGRNLIHGLDPLPKFKTVDTVKILRKHFYLNSNRQDYLGKLLLGQGKDKMEFKDWKAISEQNCPVSMRKMVKYCKGDVRNLEKIFHLIQPYERAKTHAGALAGSARWTCPITGSENVHKYKTVVSTAGIYSHQMKSNESGHYYTISDSVYKEYCAWRLDKKNAK